MKKSDLILSIGKSYPYLKKDQIIQIIDIVFEEISKSLQQGKRTEIRGFGSFSLKQRKVQLEFPSLLQQKMNFAIRNTAYFRMGKEFFDRLNSLK